MPLGEATASLAVVRTQLRDAAEKARGKDGWQSVFSGALGFDAFRAVCRNVLQLDCPDGELRVVFDSLDVEGRGKVPATEIVQFIADPLQRMASRMNAAWLDLGEDWEFFVERLATDHGGRIDLDEFRRMCTEDLLLSEHQAQVDLAFSFLDTTGLGGVSVDALASVLQRGGDASAPNALPKAAVADPAKAAESEGDEFAAEEEEAHESWQAPKRSASEDFEDDGSGAEGPSTIPGATPGAAVEAEESDFEGDETPGATRAPVAGVAESDDEGFEGEDGFEAEAPGGAIRSAANMQEDDARGARAVAVAYDHVGVPGAAVAISPAAAHEDEDDDEFEDEDGAGRGEDDDGIEDEETGAGGGAVVLSSAAVVGSALEDAHGAGGGAALGEDDFEDDAPAIGGMALAIANRGAADEDGDASGDGDAEYEGFDDDEERDAHVATVFDDAGIGTCGGGLASVLETANVGSAWEHQRASGTGGGDDASAVEARQRDADALYAAVVPEFEEHREEKLFQQFEGDTRTEALLSAVMPEFSEEDPFAKPSRARDDNEDEEDDLDITALRSRILHKTSTHSGRAVVDSIGREVAGGAVATDDDDADGDDMGGPGLQAGLVPGGAGASYRACPRGFSDKGLVRIDVEYHAIEGTFHTKYETGRYLLSAKRFQELLVEMLCAAGVYHEVRLNPGPPEGFTSYHNLQGWYQHSDIAEKRMKSRWASRPLKRLMYPRLGSFEVRVQFPHVRHRPRGSWPGLPHEVEVFSKLKRKVWPKVRELAEWLARHLTAAKHGSRDAAEELLAEAERHSKPMQGGDGCRAEEPTPVAPVAPVRVDDPRRYRRPERNPPMWMSLRPRSAPVGPSLPRDLGPGRCGRPPALPFVEARPRARGPPSVVVERLRARLKAAAYSIGQNFAKVMWDQDRDSTAHMNWPEFRHTCRRVLRLSGEDAHLKAIFNSLDSDGTGFVSIEEIVAFVQGPVEHIRVRMRAAAQARGGDDWEHVIGLQSSDGYIDFPQFRTLCREVLGLDERDSHLRAVFAQLDYERCGDIAIDDVVEFIRSDAGRRIAAAIAADDDGRESTASSTPSGAVAPPLVESAPGAPIAMSKDEAAGTVERMRSRLKGAAYTLGGTDWQRLLRDHDTEEEGWFDWFEFRFVCRNVLKLPDDNGSLRLVFDHLDLMGTGKASVEATISFVAKGGVSLEACMELLGQAAWSNRSLIGGLREPSCRKPPDGSRSRDEGWMGSHC